MVSNYICHSCGAQSFWIFYKIKKVPAHSVLLLPTRKEALNYPQGTITLGFCHHCGFISNITFNPSFQEYSSRYEGTQAFSPTFSTFHRNLALHLIKKYDLQGKNIIEIGCGQGEFLTLLCEMGENHGIGFDPSYAGSSEKSEKTDRITFIKDFYSEKYAQYCADLVCCKMTLEHIQRTSDFIKAIRRSIGNQRNSIIFFQVPDVIRILRKLAFWDIYYEHCSYFSLGSLARLFRHCGFDVIDLWKGYDDQYLMIEARLHPGKVSSLLPEEDDLEDLRQAVSYFAQNYPHKLKEWHRQLRKFKQNRKRVAIWGAGSKAVAFLTTLKIKEEIAYAVDVNPHKQETYLAGTGHKIVGPKFLREHPPDVVIVMNPIYCKEIKKELERIEVIANIMPVR